MELPYQLLIIGFLPGRDINFYPVQLLVTLLSLQQLNLYLLNTVRVLLVKSIEYPSLLVQIFQEEDAKTELDVQGVYWEETPVKDEGKQSRNRQGEPSDPV